jgi:hypothetical protein
MRRRPREWYELGLEFDHVLALGCDASDRRRFADAVGVSPRTLYRWRADALGNSKQKTPAPRQPLRRKCACRCGEQLPASATPRRRYLNDQHRVRHWRKLNRRTEREAEQRRRTDERKIRRVRALLEEHGLLGMLHHADPEIRALGKTVREWWVRRRDP